VKHTKLTDDDRRRLAAGWDPRVSTARDYGRSVGVSERALRVWRAKFVADQQTAMPERHTTVPPAHTLEVLHARLLEADAAVDAARAAVAACRSVLDAAAASAASSGISTPGDGCQVVAVVPEPGSADANATDVARIPGEPAVEPHGPAPTAVSTAESVPNRRRGAFCWEMDGLT
jgi:transposase-like protein